MTYRAILRHIKKIDFEQIFLKNIVGKNIVHRGRGFRGANSDYDEIPSQQRRIAIAIKSRKEVGNWRPSIEWTVEGR